MTTKKILLAFPPTMLAQVDYIAKQEHRTRSDLLREALRRYIDQFRQRQFLPDSDDLIKQERDHKILNELKAQVEGDGRVVQMPPVATYDGPALAPSARPLYER